MTQEPIQIQTYLTYKLGNADMEYLKFYASKALGNNEELTVKLTESWRNSYKENDFRRVFFSVMEKFYDKIQSLEGEILRYQQIEKQLRNYQQFKNYLFIIERFNLIDNSRVELRNYSKNQDPQDKKCTEIVQKMRYLEEKYTPIVEYQQLKSKYEKASNDLEVYQKSLQYINEPSMLKLFLSKRENLISLKSQQIQKLTKTIQVTSQVDRFKKVFEYYETNLSEISQQLKKSIICLDGVRKMIQIQQQSNNNWVKQNKYLKKAHVCLSDLIENIQKSKQQITGDQMNKIKVETSISTGIKSIFKAFLHLLEANFSETSIANLIETISKFNFNNKEIEELINKFIEIGTIERKMHEFQSQVEAIWMNQQSTIDKSISSIKKVEKNISVFSWSLDNSKYHDKQQLKQMKNMFQTYFAKKLLIHLGEQKKLNLKQSCLPNIIKSYSSHFSSEFSESLKRIDERKDKENKYLQGIRKRLEQIYFSLLNKRYRNPNMDPNSIGFYSQMKSIVDQLALQTEKFSAEKKKQIQGSSPQRNWSVQCLQQDIKTVKESNKILQQELLNSKSQIELLKADNKNSENSKKNLQQSIVNLYNKIALLQRQKEIQLSLRVKYERQKQTQLKLKQQAFLKLQKITLNYAQLQSKHQFDKKQLNDRIKQLNQQLVKQKETTYELKLKVYQLSTATSQNAITSVFYNQVSPSPWNKNESEQSTDKLIRQMMSILIIVIDKINKQESKLNRKGQKGSINQQQLIQKINSFINLYNKYLTQHSIISNQQMDIINSITPNWFLPSNQKESSKQYQEQSIDEQIIYPDSPKSDNEKFETLQPDDQIKLRQEIKQKQDQIDKLQQTNRQLLQQINQSNRRLEDQINKIGQMASQNGKLKGQLQRNSYQKQRLTAELDHQKKYNLQQTIQLTNLKKELEQNKSDKEKSQFELEKIIQELNQTIQKQNINKTSLLKQLDEVKNQRQTLKNQINKLIINHSNTDQSKNKQLNDCKLRLNQQSTQLNNTIQELNEQKGKLNLDNKQLLEKISSLESQNKDQTSNLQNLATINSQLSTDNELFVKNNEQLLIKNAKLQNELKDSQQKFNSQYVKLQQSIQQQLIEQKAQFEKQFQQKIQLKFEQFKKQQLEQIVDPQQQRDFSQITDVVILQKQIKSKTKTNRNLLNSNYQLQDQIERIKNQKFKISKDLSQTKKLIDEIKKANLLQIKKLTIERNRALQAVQKQKKAAEFKAKVQKMNSNSDGLSQMQRLQFGKVRNDLENEKKKHQNNLQEKNNKIRQLEHRIDQLTEQNNRILKINYQQRQAITSYEQMMIKNPLNNQQNKQIPQYTIIFDRFFVGECMNNQYTKKYQLFDLIQSKNKKYIQRTRLIYRFDPINPTNFHNYIDGVENFLLIVRTQKCIIGAFSTSKMEKNSSEPEDSISFLFSFADSMKIRAFDFHRRIRGGKALSWDEFFLVIGNAQIRLRFQQKRVASNFGIQNAFFETNGYTVSGFLNESNSRETDLVSYECYQVVFK